MLDKLRNNKVLHVIGNIIYAIALLLVLLILIVVCIQRISNNNVALGGIRIYSVVTGSMLPKYEIGDILVSKEVDLQDIKIGDDITYIADEKTTVEGKFVTHSVVAIREENGEYKFTTKGIANTAEDPEISGNQIFGKVVYRPVLLSFINKIIKNMYAFYFIIIVPMAIIIAKMMVEFIIRRQEKKERKLVEDDSKEKQDEVTIVQEKIEQKESKKKTRKRF